MNGFLRGLPAIGLTVLILGTVNPIVCAAGSSASGAATAPSSPSAGSTSGSPLSSDFSLTISPAHLTIGQADIGTVQKIAVSNQGRASVAVTVQKRDFTTGTDGAQVFQDNGKYGASEWVTASPASFDLASGSRQTVTAAVTVPANPDPGDRQVSLVFLAVEPGNGNIKINRGIAMPVFITVPGPVDTTSSVSDLSAPGFATGGPVPITATVRNTGTVHRDFHGESPLLVDVPGTAAPFPDFIVARDSVRDISTTWDPPLFGVFNPTVTMTNADGTTSSASVRVVVFPIQKAAILLGALLLLVVGFWFFRRRYKASVRKAALSMNSATGGGDA